MWSFFIDLYSVSVSPKGWTDQELGLKWLERDFEPNTRPENPHEFRLLILDGHNSHCTYPFIKFSAQHHIVIICLPSHTTHALQPCDVGVFGPLAHAWKSQVTKASQDNVPITKSNLLLYYHNARNIALKPTTIQSAFRKTGIYPFNRNAIPTDAFEPAKNTTTEAAQPLPAQLPPSLVPTPNPSPATSAATLTPNATPVASAAPASLDLDIGIIDTGPGTPTEATTDHVQRYHIVVSPPLPHTSSRRALREENAMLREVIERVGVELEQDYAQMKLMDLENKQLRQKAFAKDQRKAAKGKLTSGQARHMTAPEMIDLLARQTWESTMKDLFKEASERFKAMRKEIDEHHKQIIAEKKAAEKAKKAAEREVKRVEAEVEKARTQAERAAARGRGRGSRRATHAYGTRGRGIRGRNGRGQGGREAALTAQEYSSHSEERILSESDSNGTQDNDIPSIPIPGITAMHSQRRLPRECRVRAPRFFVDDNNEDVPAAHLIRPRPRPRPIPIRPAQATLGPSLVHNDLSGGIVTSTLPPRAKHDDVDAEREPILVASTELEQGPEVQQNHHQVGLEQPTSAWSGEDQPKGVEASFLGAILSSEQNIVSAGNNNVELPQRRSTRLAKKR